MTMFHYFDDPELAGDEELAALIQEVRCSAMGPAPEARPQLLAVLTKGLGGCPELVTAPPAVAPPPRSRPRRRLADRLQGTRARLALAAAVASVSFLGTGAAGALPGPAQSAFERTASAVGVELPSTGGGNEDTPVRARPSPGTPSAEEDRGGVGSDGGRPAPESLPEDDQPAPAAPRPSGGQLPSSPTPLPGDGPEDQGGRGSPQTAPGKATVGPGRSDEHQGGPPAGVPGADNGDDDRQGPPKTTPAQLGDGAASGAATLPADAAHRSPSSLR